MEQPQSNTAENVAEVTMLDNGGAVVRVEVTPTMMAAIGLMGMVANLRLEQTAALSALGVLAQLDHRVTELYLLTLAYTSREGLRLVVLSEQAGGDA